MVRPSPTASATSFAVGTKRKGNDGNTYAVIATKTGVQRWVKKTKATTGTSCWKEENTSCWKSRLVPESYEMDLQNFAEYLQYLQREFITYPISGKKWCLNTGVCSYL